MDARTCGRACPERRPDGDSALTQASTCVKLSYLEALYSAVCIGMEQNFREAGRSAGRIFQNSNGIFLESSPYTLFVCVKAYSRLVCMLKEASEASEGSI